MYRILTLNKISEKGLSELRVNNFQVSDKEKEPEGILLRSYAMHDMDLPQSLLAVARAGAGTNNIPIEKCSEKGIVVFNTPGANANAVKELVLAALFLSSRKIVEGINWVKTLEEEEEVDKLVEKGKSQFTGPEILGKKLGVIGLGAIGVKVANAAKKLGMEVIGYDPFLSVDAAWNLSSSILRGDNLENVVSQCDYITIHIPLNDKTKHLFNKGIFSCMKKEARLLNFSRGELVEEEALRQALEDGTLSKYVTDFADKKVLHMKNTLVLPHLGASTPESEDNCAQMAALQLKAYLEYGTIKNSVNWPNCEIPYEGKRRISILHRNIPNMVTSIATVFSKECINIDNMLNKSKGIWACTLIDADDLKGKDAELVEELKKINTVVCARIVK